MRKVTVNLTPAVAVNINTVVVSAGERFLSCTILV